MRAFTAIRFGLYAVIIALGAHHLLTRGGDEARAVPEEPKGSWIAGRTSQGLPVGLKFNGAHAVRLGFTWQTRCSDGRPILNQKVRFVDAEPYAFTRDGARFKVRWELPEEWPDGRLYALQGQLEGREAGRSASGIVRLRTVHRDEANRTVTCDSGLLRWSAAG